MRRGVLLLFVLLAVGFAPAPLPRAERRPRPTSEFDGLWSGGYSYTGKLEQNNIVVRITRGRVIYHPEQEKPAVYDLRIDRSVSPARYHLDGLAGTPAQGYRLRGIIRVEGDLLKLSFKETDQPWPTAFEGAGKGLHGEAYRRTRR
jgi:uncharacterized protein (TIGR03067 family)